MSCDRHRSHWRETNIIPPVTVTTVHYKYVSTPRRMCYTAMGILDSGLPEWSYTNIVNMATTYRRTRIKARPRPFRRNMRFVKRVPKVRKFAGRARGGVRRYPKRNFRSRVLNITTRKKQDTMVAWGGNLNGDGEGYVQGPTSVPATNGGEAFLWMATARGITIDNTSGESNVNDTATRTATKCFMVGLKERIEIKTNTDDPWRWRRVVFKFKGEDIIRPAAGDEENRVVEPWLETSNGYARLFPKITNTGDLEIGTLNARLQEHLFKGVFQKDWDSVMNAKLTSDHVDIISDKLRTIQSQNGKGRFRTVKEWIPFNKTLIYNDFETGGDVTAKEISAMSKDSMGDVYIADFFEPITSGSQLLNFWPQSTLYWHER